MNGKHLMSFQSETSVFKFSWPSVDGVLGETYKTTINDKPKENRGKDDKD